MEMMVSYCTDIGGGRTVNQDSLSVKVAASPKGKAAFAIVCDGMGGLEEGELASKEAVMAFHNWFAVDFAQLAAKGAVSKERIYSQWSSLIKAVHQNIREYANEQGIRMGTTLSALLVYQGNYFICHVGDSRIYQIGKTITKMTQDHTLADYEVRSGRLTRKQAQWDYRNNILLQCIGACEGVHPQLLSGTVAGGTTFLISSDGLLHRITEEELYRCFQPENFTEQKQMKRACAEAVRTAVDRGEQDNITVVTLVVKEEKKAGRRRQRC